MPLWNFHHSPNLLSPEEKKALAGEITKLYLPAGLPAFYVQVRFTEVEPASTFVGGEEHAKFAGIEITHIARNFSTPEHRKGFLERIDKVLDPVMKSKSADWEYFIFETPRDLWKRNGLVPPPSGSEMEKEWVRQNRPIEY